MYIKRSLEQAIRKASAHFKVILLTGPRQVGKTTLLEHIEPTQRSYITLDDLNLRIAAEQDPASFIERLQLPVLIDEIQYAPSLLPYIKIKVDKLKKPGLFWLTGSQQFEMMKHVSESLAGRVAVFQLQGISLAEEQNRAEGPVFSPDINIIKTRQTLAKSLSIMEIYHNIWRGSYPDVVATQGEYWQQFYESYVTTYIQRDVRDYLRIENLAAFHKFMQIAASRSGQIINFRDMSSDIGVSEPTVRSWLNVLHASGIIYLLQPYFNNHSKRLIKTPKLYFMDTGLCCFLSGWLTPEVLERGAMNGAMLETYVVSEVVKSYLGNGQTPRIYFYRDKEKREIDLLIEEKNLLYPIEIKKTASLKNIHIKHFNVLDALGVGLGQGAVLCLVSTPLPFSSTIEAIPISYI